MDTQTLLGFMSVIFSVVGLAMAWFGWQTRKKYQLITGTSTTEIRDIDDEGLVEVKGTISGSVDGSRFVSPIGQTDDTVFATWEVKELREEGRGDDENLVWKTIRSGIDSRPFHLDDGTSQIQVAIEDRPADVTSKFEEDPVVERVNVDSIPPVHIRTFAQERDLPEPVEPSTTAQIFDINRPDADIGDRRYSESTLGSGDEIYVLGQVRAVEGATTPLHSEDAVITLAEDETFVISDLPEDELTQQISSDYRSMIALGALFFTIGAGLLVIAISFL